MSIGKEVENIRAKGIRFNQISQLSEKYQQKIKEIKFNFLNKFGYSPKLLECVYILENNIDSPFICRNNNCNNYGIFHNSRGYCYCSRKCSDSDSNRSSIIGKKCKDSRVLNGSYSTGALKGAETKKNIIDPVSGLNLHQINGIKRSSYVANNYDIVQCQLTKGRTKYTSEKRKLAAQKRKETINSVYGVSHFGGGLSRLKDVVINDITYKIQGYEDIAIYELIYLCGIDPLDIIVINQSKEYAIPYVDKAGNKRNYYPDLYVKSDNIYLEIKSPYWYNLTEDDTNRKIIAAKNSGLDIELILYRDKKYVTRIRKIIKTAQR